jgi:hypothetical protein
VSIQNRAVTENRAVSRYPTNFSCRFGFGGLFHDANMMNISMDGAFLWSSFVPPQGSHVVITLRSPVLKSISTMEGEVVRTESALEGGVNAVEV